MKETENKITGQENRVSEKENILKLRKPIFIDGKEVSEIPYDFEELTGKDVDDAFKAARKNGYMITGAYEMDPIIGGYMFAQAAGIDYLDLERLSAKDFAKAGSLGRDFFIADLGGDQAEDTSK